MLLEFLVSSNQDETFYQPLKVVNLANEHERLQWREKLGEVLSEKTLYVSEVTSQKMSYLKDSPISLESSHKTSNCR